jgi:predicted O-methyltransferase YrrM
MKKIIRYFLRQWRIRKIVAQHPALKRAYEVQSHLTDEERFKLYELAQGKKKILEIGSYLGASATCFGAAVQNSSAKIYCIDTWNNDAMTEGKKDTFKTFTENTAPFKNNIVPIRGFSTAVIGQVRNMTTGLDLLFIDGDHSYEGAKADWDTYQGLLQRGAVVIFHDIGWAEGVQRVVSEDARPRVSSFGQLPNLWWGTIA